MTPPSAREDSFVCINCVEFGDLSTVTEFTHLSHRALTIVCAVFADAPMCLTDKLQRVLNVAARVVSVTKHNREIRDVCVTLRYTNFPFYSILPRSSTAAWHISCTLCSTSWSSCSCKLQDRDQGVWSRPWPTVLGWLLCTCHRSRHSSRKRMKHGKKRKKSRFLEFEKNVKNVKT